MFQLPQQQNKPCGLLQTEETGAQSHSPAFGCWDGTSGNPAPGSRCLRLFARKIYLQLWSLTMGTLSSSPGSLGYRSCCVMGTVFLLLTAAEPSSPRARGLGVISAMPLALRIPLTLSSPPSLEKQAQRMSCWGRAKRGAETEESQTAPAIPPCASSPSCLTSERKSNAGRRKEKERGSAQVGQECTSIPSELS